MNTVLKKEFTVSKGLFVPVYRNIPTAPEPVIGGFAYDNSTQRLLLSDGSTWYSPGASPATSTGRGLVYGTTSSVDPSPTGIGYICGTAMGENVFLGNESGSLNNSNQTGLTFVGRSSGRPTQFGNNITLIGNSSGTGVGQQANTTGVGYAVFANAVCQDGTSIGNFSQLANNGARSCGIGFRTFGVSLAPVYQDCVAIGVSRLTSPQICTGIINVGSSATEWSSGNSDDVIYIGNGTTLSSNIANVVAIGSGTFAGAAVANNTFAAADDITQWRSLGLSVSASANILQFDPVTGLITQAASSRRFKEDIQDITKDSIPSLEDAKVRTYEIDGDTDRGVISEDIPEFFATFDKEGQRNGVVFARFIMALLSEIQTLKKDLVIARRRKGL
ncbi:hypothetical protein [Brazilian marseillevirus]|uniref:hypothetical protein n=1 Tax=Brazilian marseillevirus TaxID=1813599 RepID=UPI0007847015|nr:hypothetical protein A3303_gp034 [Brazilian marseillevirus]AMQ10542.1 hypothetical protein [Brazilian marseillevirus]